MPGVRQGIIAVVGEAAEEDGVTCDGVVAEGGCLAWARTKAACGCPGVGVEVKKPGVGEGLAAVVTPAVEEKLAGVGEEGEGGVGAWGGESDAGIDQRPRHPIIPPQILINRLPIGSAKEINISRFPAHHHMPAARGRRRCRELPRPIGAIIHPRFPIGGVILVAATKEKHLAAGGIVDHIRAIACRGRHGCRHLGPIDTIKLPRFIAVGPGVGIAPVEDEDAAPRIIGQCIFPAGLWGMRRY